MKQYCLHCIYVVAVFAAGSTVNLCHLQLIVAVMSSQDLTDRLDILTEFIHLGFLILTVYKHVVGTSANFFFTSGSDEVDIRIKHEERAKKNLPLCCFFLRLLLRINSYANPKYFFTFGPRVAWKLRNTRKTAASVGRIVINERH